MRVGFVITEVLNGFRRNITMTIAMILTTAISLGLLGGGLIIARMTDQMRDIYGDKVEVTIYLSPDLSASDPDCRVSPCQDINQQLKANTDEAIARGAFGSPTIYLNKTDMYFGNDRLPLVRDAVARSLLTSGNPA